MMRQDLTLDMGSEDRLWTVGDLARFLGTTENAVRAMRKRKEIPLDCSCRVGRRRLRFVPSKIRQWLGLGGLTNRECAK